MLHDLARLSDEQRELELAEIDLVHQAVGACGPLAEHRGIELHDRTENPASASAWRS